MKSLSLLLAAVGLKSALGTMDAVHDAFPLSEVADQAPEYAHQIPDSTALASLFLEDRRTSAFVNYNDFVIANATEDTRVQTGPAQRVPCDIAANNVISQNLPYVPASGMCIHTVHTVIMPGKTYSFEATPTQAYSDMVSTLADLGLANNYPAVAEVHGKHGQIGGNDKMYTVAEVKYTVNCYAPEDLTDSNGQIYTQNNAYGITGFRPVDIVSDKRYYNPSGIAIADSTADMALSLASGSASNQDVTDIRMYAEIGVAASRGAVAKNVCGFKVDVDQRDLVTIGHVAIGAVPSETALIEGGMSTSDVLFEHKEQLTFPGLTPQIQDTVGSGGSVSDITVSEEDTKVIDDDSGTQALAVGERTLYLECDTQLSSWAKYDSITWSNDPSASNIQTSGQNKEVYIETPILIHEVTTCDRVHFVDSWAPGADGEEIGTHIDPYKLGPNGIVTTGAPHTHAEWTPYIGDVNPFAIGYNANSGVWVSDMTTGNHSAFSVAYKLLDGVGTVHSCCGQRQSCDQFSGDVILDGQGTSTPWLSLGEKDMCSEDALTVQLALLKGNTLEHGFERLWLARTDARHEEQGLKVKMSVFTHTTIGDQTTA